MRNVCRKEKKFLVDMASARTLEHNLAAILPADPHNGFNGYPVRSLYFDTLHDRDFAEKLFGLEIRRKVRLRVYSPTADFALLELKQKQVDNQQKRSLRLSKEEAQAVIAGNLDVLLEREEPFAAEIHALMSINGYMPKAIVEYDRTAFIAKENKIRITIDRNIRATETNYDLFDPNLCMTSVLDPFNVVLEVKFDGFLLSYIRQVLNTVQKSEISVSKYCLARTTRLGYQF